MFLDQSWPNENLPETWKALRGRWRSLPEVPGLKMEWGTNHRCLVSHVLSSDFCTFSDWCLLPQTGPSDQPPESSLQTHRVTTTQKQKRRLLTGKMSGIKDISAERDPEITATPAILGLQTYERGQYVPCNPHQVIQATRAAWVTLGKTNRGNTLSNLEIKNASLLF